MAACSRPKILVVDDDESTRWLLGKVLERIQAELFFADSATSAIVSIDSNCAIDLVVCDYHMGRESGIEVLHHLRSHQQQTPFLLFTSEEQDKIPPFESPNASYIQKPELTALLNEVGRFLSSREHGKIS